MSGVSRVSVGAWRRRDQLLWGHLLYLRNRQRLLNT